MKHQSHLVPVVQQWYTLKEVKSKAWKIKHCPASSNCENTVLQGNKAKIVRGKVKCSSKSQQKLTRFPMTPFKKIGSERLCRVKALQDYIGKAAAQNT
jgi:hypothetical protein